MSKKQVRIVEEVKNDSDHQLKSDSEEEACQQEDDGADIESIGHNSGKTKYRGYMTEQQKKGLVQSSMLPKKDDLVKIKTQKELFVAEAD